MPVQPTHLTLDEVHTYAPNDDDPDAPGNVPIPNEDPGPSWPDGWDSEGAYLP